MTRFSTLLLSLFILGASVLHAADKITLHPGETYYARFQQKGKKIRLVSATQEKDTTAQLVISLSPKDKDGLTTLKLESGFTDDLIYKATIWSKILKRHGSLDVYPIVGGKKGTVKLPPLVEEIVLFDFRFEPATLIEKEKDGP